MSDCQAEDEVHVGIPGVDGLPGDDHWEYVMCGQEATTEITFRDLDEDVHHPTTRSVCDEHADSLRWAASEGYVELISDDRFSAV